MFNIKIFEELNYKLLYIKELNNFLVIKDDLNIKSLNENISEENLLDLINTISPQDLNKFKKILNTRKNNINLYDIDTNYLHYSLCLHPSRKCNLSCKYCFAKDNDKLPKKGLDINTAKDALDFLIYKLGPNAGKYYVDLSGSGEPLLSFDFIVEMEKYCQIKSSETGKEIKIMFPTNALLLDKDKAKYFLEKSNILLGVSIDGNFNQNSNRILKDGSSSYNLVAKNIDLVQDRPIGLAVTITHQNEDVDELFNHLYYRFPNTDAISMQVVRDFSLTSETSFYKINIDNLIKGYRRLCENLIFQMNQNNFDYIFTLLRGVDTFGTYILRALNRGKLNRFRCGAGKNRIAVDEKGNIFTCTVVSGEDRFLIGNIYSGIALEKQLPHTKVNVDSVDSCKDCWASYICSGECPAASYLTDGTFYNPNTQICNFRKKLIKLSIAFIEKLKLEYPHFYDELINFSTTKSFFESYTNSGYWAINYYLKHNFTDITFNQITDNLQTSNRGIKPNDLKEFIIKYIPNYRAFELDDSKYYKTLKFPIIAYLNKINYPYYEYVIILGITDNYLKILTPNISTPYMISIDIFLNNMSSIIFSN